MRGRLAIDSRFETFHPSTFEALAAIRSEPLRIAPGSPGRTCTCSTRQPAPTGPLAHVLEREPGVVELYASERVVVLRRR